MSSDRYFPLWVRDKEEIFKSEDGAECHDGQRLDYSMTNARVKQEKDDCDQAGSIEGSFKINP